MWYEKDHKLILLFHKDILFPQSHGSSSAIGFQDEGLSFRAQKQLIPVTSASSGIL